MCVTLQKVRHFYSPNSQLHSYLYIFTSPFPLMHDRNVSIFLAKVLDYVSCISDVFPKSGSFFLFQILKQMGFVFFVLSCVFIRIIVSLHFFTPHIKVGQIKSSVPNGSRVWSCCLQTSQVHADEIHTARISSWNFMPLCLCVKPVLNISSHTWSCFQNGTEQVLNRRWGNSAFLPLWNVKFDPYRS